MSMTESEALGMLRAKLTCMELEDLACIEKGCDKDCDNCNYCYEQGNRGQSKEALAIAIKALEEIQQYRAIGTVEELRELKEKATEKKPVYSDFDENGEVDENGEAVIIPYKAVCPVCGYEFEFGTWNDEENHHCECGQRMLWD